MKTTKRVLGLLNGVLLGAIAAAFLTPAIGMTLSLVVMALSLPLSVWASNNGFALAIVNPATITWNGKEVMSMTEAIMESVYTNPQLSELHQVIENIVAKQQIVFLGTLSKVTKKKTTCSDSPGTHTIGLSEKFWNPERVVLWLQECADTLEESFWVWGLQKGIARKELTDTDFADFIMTRMESAAIEDILRIVWFNDVNHANVDDSPAGVLTSGISELDYNIIDGLWAQAYDIVAGDADRRYTIALNAEATYANQAFDATDTTNKLAHSILQGVIDGADDRLKEKSNLVFYVTGSIYDQYKKELKSYTGIESAFEMNQAGKKELMFDGYPVKPMRFWDRTIKADFDNGTSYFQPHRVMLTVKENIPVGVDGLEAVTTMKQWYNPDTEKSNWKAGYKVDAKILENYLIQVAY